MDARFKTGMERAGGVAGASLRGAAPGCRYDGASRAWKKA